MIMMQGLHWYWPKLASPYTEHTHTHLHSHTHTHTHTHTQTDLHYLDKCFASVLHFYHGNRPLLTRPSPSLVLSSAPEKHVLIFCCQPTSLAVISYFSVWNYCHSWPPFLLTFGQHLLFGKLFNLMKQYTYNFKVVLTRMLCPYQFQGGCSNMLREQEGNRMFRFSLMPRRRFRTGPPRLQ